MADKKTIALNERDSAAMLQQCGVNMVPCALLEKEDEAAFAAAIKQLAADAGLRARMGQAGREKMQRYALDTVLPQVMERYLSVTGKR